MRLGWLLQQAELRQVGAGRACPPPPSISAAPAGPAATAARRTTSSESRRPLGGRRRRNPTAASRRVGPPFLVRQGCNRGRRERQPLAHSVAVALPDQQTVGKRRLLEGQHPRRTRFVRKGIQEGAIPAAHHERVDRRRVRRVVHVLQVDDRPAGGEGGVVQHALDVGAAGPVRAGVEVQSVAARDQHALPQTAARRRRRGAARRRGRKRGRIR